MDWKILVGVIIFLLAFVIYRQCSEDPVDYDQARQQEQLERQQRYAVTQNAKNREEEARQLKEARKKRGPRPDAKFVTLETDNYTAKFSTRGGALVSYELKSDQYLEFPRDWNQGTRNEEADLVPVNLVTTNPNKERFEVHYPLRLEIYDGLPGLLPDRDYEIIESTDKKVVFRYAQEGQPVVITKKFELDTSEYPYQIWLTIRFDNISDERISFRPGVIQTGYQHESETEGGMFTKQPNLMESVCLANDELFHDPWGEMEAPFTGKNVKFAGVGTNYFLAAMIPGDSYPTICRAEAKANRVIQTDLQWGEMDLDGGDQLILKVKNYIGPKQYQLLETVGNNLEKSVDYGWFAPISRILLWLLFKFQALVVNWGLAIILLTLVVKLVLLPLTHKSFKSSDAMKSLKPEVDKLNEKFKDSPQEKQKAIMALYKQHGVNPLGGCLPMLLQMPIWFALFKTLRASPELYRAEFFGWITDLSNPDPYYVTPIVMGAMMFLQQRMMPMGTDNAQAKMMMYIMPIMFTAMMLFLPSGLTLYILVNTVLSILHQVIIHKRRAAAKTAPLKK